MTSSYKATSQASVRISTAADNASSAAGAWFLHELALPGPGSSAGGLPARTAAMQVSAEERAGLLDEGYARGLADGEAKARAAAQTSVTDALEVVRGITTQLTEIAALGPSIVEENIAALAVIVARQIVAKEVALDRELVANLVRRALTEFPIEQSLRIRVHPLDLSVLTLNAGADGSARITGTRDASWLADPRIARGGCLVEGRDRIVDGRVDTALERAYRRMAKIDAS